MSCSEPPEKKPFIELSCFFTNKEEEPFSELQIDDSNFLNNISERGVCPKCNRSRRYYCYQCYVAVSEITDRIPKLRLPLKLDIIKHPKEVDGKSTSAHAAVLAPDDVSIHIYPAVPSYKDEKVLLIYPGREAVELNDALIKNSWCKKLDESTQSHAIVACPCHESKDDGYCNIPFNKVVFLDSTWKQAKQLYKDPRIIGLPCAVLKAHKSVFWRHQRGKPENYLATIEAIYYFLVELHKACYPDVPYCGHYDNLLFFFKFMYYKIRTLYDPLKLKAYQKAPDTSTSSTMQLS